MIYEPAGRAREYADLACWCPLEQCCHADLLLKLANHRGPGSPRVRCPVPPPEKPSFYLPVERADG